MESEDGQIFVKNLADFVRKHERALANALQLRSRGYSASSPAAPSTTSAIAAALSLPYLGLVSASQKPVKLTLTPHHLFYLLSRFEELNVHVGPMNVRLEDLHAGSSPGEYVSFLGSAKKAGGADHDSIHSVSSLRSVMSGMSSFWSAFSLSKTAGKTDKQRAAVKEDLRYLYSAFTKIPCLKLSPDHLAPRIRDWEIFPFDTAVPLFAFKNLSALEVYDVDFRQFYGWDRLAEQLRSVTVKRAHLDDPIELLVHVVLDDMDRRRRPKPTGSPSVPMVADMARPGDSSGLPFARRSTDELGASFSPRRPRRPRSTSPARPISQRTFSHPQRRSSGSSGSSLRSSPNTPRGSTSNLLSGQLPSSKWRFLRHLSIADNSLTTLSATSLACIANTLHSLDLSSNLFTEIPEALASMTALRALNLSSCMIESLHSLRTNPLPAVTALNLRHNRLVSLAGIERLLPLERIDLRDNKLTDPTELARLTCLPEIQDIFVNRNPFTRTHSNHRVTIVNLFRQTPGYHADITLDAAPLSSNERKLLVSRVPEPIAVPIVRPPRDETVAKLPSVQPTPTHQPDIGTQRKRKARRIVELSKQDLEPPEPPEHEDMVPDSDSVKPPAMSPDAPISQPTLPTRAASDFTSASGEAYKQKIEALRADLGSGWLSALNDQHWDHTMKDVPERVDSVAPLMQNLPVRAHSQGIVAGRTLG